MFVCKCCVVDALYMSENTCNDNFTLHFLINCFSSQIFSWLAKTS